MTKSHWIALLMIVTMSACDRSVSHAVSPPSPVFEVVSQVSAAERDAVTLARIRTLLDETPEPCPDGLVEGVGDCAPIEVTFKKKAGRKESQKQRVLVIDDGMWEEAYLTYAHRVLDFVRPTKTGRLETIDRTLVFSRGALRIFGDAIGAHNPQMSPRSFSKYSDEIYSKFLKPSPSYNLPEGDHGCFILATLAELNPNAEFVVARSGGITDDIVAEDFCLLEKDVRAFDRIRSHYLNMVSGLKELIAEYDVKFINMSFGVTALNIPRLYRKCAEGFNLSRETVDKLLRLELEEYFQPLGTIPDVILVQAGVIAPKKVLTKGDDDYLADCADIPNRVRVGEVTWASHEGTKEIAQSQLDAIECIDVIVNKGTRASKVAADRADGKTVNQDELWCASGLDVEGCQIGTSYTAPLFLSYLLYLRETDPALDTTQKLIARATEGGPLVVKDPGSRKEFLRFKNY